MDTLSYFPAEFEAFQDDYCRQQAQSYGDYQNASSPFDGTIYPPESTSDGTDIISSIPLLFGDASYPSDLNFPPSKPRSDLSFSSSGFEFLDFGEPNFSAPAAPSNIVHSEISPLTKPNGTSYQALTPSTPCQNSQIAQTYKPSKATLPVTPQSNNSFPASDAVSYAAASMHLNAAHPPLKMNKRAAKKSRGPPQALLTVFDSNIEPQSKRKCRKPFSEEGKKKVEAVRSVGACIQCRFRKRTVRLSSCP